MKYQESYRQIIGIEDEKQLKVIFSDANKLVVEAPAGYGKTFTLVNKIGYLIYSRQITWPKKVLALSFSINAAHKLKKDLLDKLSSVLKTQLDRDINQMLKVCNYHSYARGVLKLYGYLIHPNLRDVAFFENLDDSEEKNLTGAGIELCSNELSTVIRFNKAVKNVDTEIVMSFLSNYNSIMIEKFVPKNAISYDGILTLCLFLFEKYPEILSYYQSYYPIILIDEFQDTNLLSFMIVSKLTAEHNRTFFFGDSLQRIYGFIGAVPDVLESVKKNYGAEQITLEKNYRFNDNPEMLQLDTNIRLNALNPKLPVIKANTQIDFNLFDDQTNEGRYIAEKVKELLEINEDAKIAVLTRNRSNNFNKIIEIFESQGIKYFNALFSDNDKEFSSFHDFCKLEFQKLLKKQILSLNVSVLNQWSSEIKAKYPNSNELTISLITLLDLFIEKLSSDYKGLSFDNKITMVQDTLQHNGLKHYLRDIKNKVIISTVHAAKGLEWDYVILPDMENFSFPGYYGLCQECWFLYDNCNLHVHDENQKRFLEELSVFYVAVTRAKRQVFFTASRYGINGKGVEGTRNISCFLKLPGISYNLVQNECE